MMAARLLPRWRRGRWKTHRRTAVVPPDVQPQKSDRGYRCERSAPVALWVGLRVLPWASSRALACPPTARLPQHPSASAVPRRPLARRPCCLAARQPRRRPGRRSLQDSIRESWSRSGPQRANVDDSPQLLTRDSLIDSWTLLGAHLTLVMPVAITRWTCITCHRSPFGVVMVR